MEMTPPPGSILKIILDLFSFNEVDIFLRKTGGNQPNSCCTNHMTFSPVRLHTTYLTADLRTDHGCDSN